MRFSMIRFDGDAVGLKWEDERGGAVDKHEWSCDEPPTPAFKAGLAAFANYVVDIIGAPIAWGDDIEIRQLSLKEEEKTKARGIVVTALRKCERAKGRTLLVNTPYMSAPPEDYNGDGDGFLPPLVLQLIEEMEQLAEDYKLGDRGEQTQLPLGDSENTRNASERMASAEVKSTRKPKKSRNGIAEKPGVGTVFGADADQPPLDDNGLRQLLLMVERDVPVDAISRWVSSDRSKAELWAKYEQRRMAGALKPAEVSVGGPPEPECVQAAATLPLQASEV